MRTGVNVPVTIRVASGTVDCVTALRVERRYAAAIRSGALHGNGGGAELAFTGHLLDSVGARLEDVQEALKLAVEWRSFYVSR